MRIPRPLSPAELAAAPDPWSVATWEGTDGAVIIHLFPAKGNAHALDMRCWCMPKCEESTNEYGVRFVEYVHNRPN